MNTTEQKIVESSTELFLRQGIKSVTMDEVAQNLGMSKRTIYECFDNKRALLLACIDYNYEQKIKQEDAMVAKANNIVEELFYILQFSGSNYPMENKFSVELKKYFPDIFNKIYFERHGAITSTIKARLVRGIDQNIILPDTNIDIAVYVIFETIYFLLSQNERFGKMKFDMREVFNYAFISFFRGIATTKGVEMIDKMVEYKTKARV